MNVKHADRRAKGISRVQYSLIKNSTLEGVIEYYLVFYFGDHSTHAGSFDFAKGIAGELKHSWSWPVAQVQSILGLDGKLTMKISDQGAMQITVDSGMATYNYILPAQSK